LKILIISYFYYPDLSAGSFRTKSLVDILKKYNNSNLDLEVICSAPNRYKNYKHKAANKFEKINNVTIRRINVPNLGNGIISQIIGFSFFSIKLIYIVKKNNYNIIYATSAKLMTAFLAALIARTKKIPLYLDIRDLFLDSVEDMFPKIILFPIMPVLRKIEKFSFQSATRINLVSKGFKEYFKNKHISDKFSFYSNGIDREFLEYFKPQLIKNRVPVNKKMINVLYAGNIGDGQGLEKIIPKFSNSLNSKIKFKIIGSGGKMNHLLKAIKDQNCQNIEILKPIHREKLLYEYECADILFLHLNDLKAYEKVLPSKIFEYAATGKPILAGVKGYAKSFLEEEVKNSYIFKPCNLEDSLKTFDLIQLGFSDRINFNKKFERNLIMNCFAKEIVSII
tara:strand:- start:2844 stop:4028 length:1185 start_codon:yes stop_codon:yes gene_type:complete